MTISAGTRLGPYEIVAPIGAGGMGEVYKARDTRLDRNVAVKVIAADHSAAPEQLAKGPLPLEHTLRYGIEIADALARAHRHGIVHRDLKPGNVMLTRSGV